MPQRCLIMFLQALGSNYTKEVYKYQLDRFLAWNKTKDYDDLLKGDEKAIQRNLEDYLIYLKDKFSPNYIPSILAPIELFYTMNEVNLNTKRLHKMFPTKIKKGGYGHYTKENIASMLENTAKKRSKALILFLSSTGCRVGVIPTPNDKVIIKSGDTVNVTLSIYIEFFGSITIEQGGKLIITVTETSEATGIFEGTVVLIPDDSSGNKLRVTEGDAITAKYEDNTLPDPYTTADELDITATFKKILYSPGIDVAITFGSSSPGCQINETCFYPSSFNVDSGGIVDWDNLDTAVHTVTSGTPGGGPDGEFDSGLVNSGGTFSHQFLTQGTFPYFDLLHPWMTGTISVNPSECQIPSIGNWVISSSCILSVNAPAPANIIVQNGAVLTILNGATLDVDFANFNLTVESGSGVLIKDGGTIT